MNKGEEICRCHICGGEMKLKNLQWHLRSHEIKPEDYYCKYIGEKKYCPTCGRETSFEGVTHGYKEGFCSYRCEQIAKGVDVESDSYKKTHHCLICGVEVHQLRSHLRTAHVISNKDYYDRYYKTEGEGICLGCGKPTVFDQHFRYRDYCSIACMNKSDRHKEQAKQTSLEKYGVTNPSQSKEIQAKIRANNLEKYGVEWHSQDESIKQKTHKTNLAKYGSVSPLGSPVIQEKIKQTNLARYGYENAACAPMVKEKMKNTNLERYGCIAPAQNQNVREKTAQTNLERYGHECPAGSPEVKDKTHRTVLEVYGTDNPMQSEQVKKEGETD